MIRPFELLVLFAGTWAIAVVTVLAIQYVRNGRNKIDAELLPKDEPMAPPRRLPRLVEPWPLPFAPKQAEEPPRWRAPKQKRSTTWAK